MFTRRKKYKQNIDLDPSSPQAHIKSKTTDMKLQYKLIKMNKKI